MSELGDKLRALALEADGVQPAPAEYAGPPGTVAVRPTGVNAKGVVHYWPAPAGEGNAWSYVTRAASMINPLTEQPYYPPSILGVFLYSRWPQGLPNVPENYPIVADYNLYPELWWDQVEADRQQGMHDRDVAAGAVFSPR
jgi:hypothetical protein